MIIDKNRHLLPQQHIATENRTKKEKDKKDRYVRKNVN